MTDFSATPGRPMPAGAGALSFGMLGDWARRSDLWLAFGVMGILVVLIFPLPPLILDMLLAFSIITSVLILMTALFIEEPLDFHDAEARAEPRLDPPHPRQWP
jgi:flagellar biosynthesis protein FlhA